jgi:hypothetical protein
MTTSLSLESLSDDHFVYPFPLGARLLSDFWRTVRWWRQFGLPSRVPG